MRFFRMIIVVVAVFLMWAPDAIARAGIDCTTVEGSFPQPPQTLQSFESAGKDRLTAYQFGGDRMLVAEVSGGRHGVYKIRPLWSRGNFDDRLYWVVPDTRDLKLPLVVPSLDGFKVGDPVVGTDRNARTFDGRVKRLFSNRVVLVEHTDKKGSWYHPWPLKDIETTRNVDRTPPYVPKPEINDIDAFLSGKNGVKPVTEQFNDAFHLSAGQMVLHKRENGSRFVAICESSATYPVKWPFRELNLKTGKFGDPQMYSIIYSHRDPFRVITAKIGNLSRNQEVVGFDQRGNEFKGKILALFERDYALVDHRGHGGKLEIWKTRRLRPIGAAHHLSLQNSSRTEEKTGK